MALTLKQNLKLSQSLVITPQLQQAIKLLQLSHIELAELVQEEMLENPMLEESPEIEDLPHGDPEIVAERQELDASLNGISANHNEEVGGPNADLNQEPKDFDWENYINTYTNSYSAPEQIARENEDEQNPFASSSSPMSLFDHLVWQLNLSNLTQKEMEIGAEIIGNIGDDGYLRASLEEIAESLPMEADLEEIDAVLHTVQNFDPIGVGARDLKECLLIQIDHLSEDQNILRKMVNHYLPELEKHNYQKIAKGLKVNLQRAHNLARIILSLEPKPGRSFSTGNAQYITPDVYVRKIGDEWVVQLNEDGLPRLKVSNYYKNMLGEQDKPDAKDYVQSKLKSAVWLIRSIQQRQKTLFKTSKTILRLQKDFFENGIEHLKPMTIKDVANEIEMHESTVSRVTTNKFMHTPHGILELKFFFNSGIATTQGTMVASESIKDKIRQIIAGEKPDSPLSDQEIVESLKKINIIIARRTVAKYRENLGILPSSRRKQIL